MFGLIIGGAIGNLFDRLFGWIFYKGEWKFIFKQGVVDWIDTGIPKGIFGLENGWRWYTFNMADAFVTVSMILLLFYIYLYSNLYLRLELRLEVILILSGDGHENTC